MSAFVLGFLAADSLPSAPIETLGSYEGPRLYERPWNMAPK